MTLKCFCVRLRPDVRPQLPALQHSFVQHATLHRALFVGHNQPLCVCELRYFYACVCVCVCVCTDRLKPPSCPSCKPTPPHSSSSERNLTIPIKLLGLRPSHLGPPSIRTRYVRFDQASQLEILSFAFCISRNNRTGARACL